MILHPYSTDKLAVPRDFTLLPQPPRPPELSLVENIWWLMRGNWLSSGASKSHDDIAALCQFCRACLTAVVRDARRYRDLPQQIGKPRHVNVK